METAARRRIGRTGHVASQNNPLPVPFDDRVGDRDSREERLGVGMQGMVVKLLPFSQFNNFAQVHYRRTIGDVTHHAQIVGDEQIGQPELILQLLQQVDDPIRGLGHLGIGEDYEQAASREVAEELGLERARAVEALLTEHGLTRRS